MKVASVKIHNILGIEDFEIMPKEINRFEGKNATGKTSTLEAIKAALKGGHDATLLRNGAEEGQVVILLDDGLEIKKTITADKTDLSVKYPRSGVKVDKPQTHLNALIDALSINPVEFLTAPSGKRAEYLLQAMPLKVSAADLKGIFDYIPDPKEHAFTVLAAVDKLIYDERTGVNRLKDEKRKTAKQLGETLPLEEEPTDWAAVLKENNQKLAEARSDKKNKADTIDKDFKAARAKIESDLNRDQNVIESMYQVKLRELQTWKSDEMAKLADNEKAEIERVNSERTAAMNGLDGIDKQIGELMGAVSEAETKTKTQTVHENTRKMIAQHEDEAMKHEADSDALTARLASLDALRLRILSNLPIPGVTVENGQVMKDGVVYDRLNTASQIDIAVAIAKLRAKDLGIVCVDGLECLDEENFQAFETAMHGSGLQCFITRVTNSPMEVTTK